MTTVAIAAFGSRGDVAPLTGIGARLRDAGHRVVLAAPEPFADLVRGCGLEFRQIDVDLGIDGDPEESNPLKLVASLMAPKGMRAMGAGILAALRDVPADVLLLSPFTELVGHQLAEARGIPSIGVRLQPLSATASHPPAILGAWSAGALGNRAAARFGAGVYDRVYAGTIAVFRDELGLPALSARAQRRRRTEAQWPILHGFSPSVVPRPADWRGGLDVVGYWWPARPTDWQPPEELARFLADGPPPVFVGFSSLPMRKAESARMSTLVGRALRDAGVRGVIQAGWAGLEHSDDNTLTIGEVPHDWLFDRVSAVIHPAGAGTTAAGLRAGVPAITVPATGGDQPFWARRLRDLGVSAGTFSQRKLTAQGLSTAIGTALTDTALRDNARRLAARLAEEDGAGQVLTAVDKLLH